MKNNEATMTCEVCNQTIDRPLGLSPVRWQKRRFCSNKCKLKKLSDKPIVNTEEKFWLLVNKTDTCWLWLGSRNRKHYGQFRFKGKTRPAHRVAYLLIEGSINQELQLDHLCRVPLCVNPTHLEPVTSHENQRRSPIANMSKTHCKNGHEFTPENTALRSNRKWRQCIACRRIMFKRWYTKQKDAFDEEDEL